MSLPATVIDSVVFRDIFSTPAMRRVFSDETRVQRCLDVEAALAKVEARLGLIPAAAAQEIARHCAVGQFDLAKLKTETERVGSPIIPVVQQLIQLCEGGHGEWCHWGATTQDITDTATVLQIRDALAIVAQELDAIAAALAKLAQRYRDTPMAGRSNLQQAVPITFGYKVAVWLSGIERHRERLAQLKPRALVGEFAGAVGTLASLGPHGLEVQAGLMQELNLGQPTIAWHVMRDQIAEVGCFLGLVTGTLGKIALDVKLMMQTEVAEVAEPFHAGRGSSSTMPQKRNPVSCNYITACVAMVRQHAGALMDAMLEDHERATGSWQIEWVALPEIFLLAAGALAHSRTMLEGLQVDAKRMRANLALTGGLIVAEAVTMGLADKLGRNQSHHLVSQIARRVAAAEGSFLELLAAEPEIARHADRPALVRLLDPANYLGLAGAMVDRVLAGRG